MLWATGSHSVFEVVCFSLPWSLLPSQYFTSLKAVFPSVPAYNWGMAAIVVQHFILNSAEFCDICIHQDFLLCVQFWIWVCVCTKAKRENFTNTCTDTCTCSYCTERCEISICMASGLYLTDFLCRQCTCEMDRDFCWALERGFSCEVLERRIDLFTSPSNRELVQLELELMGDLGVSTCTELKITNQLRLTLCGWLDDFSQQPFK